MIEINYSEKNERIEINFYGFYFSDILDFIREEKFTYLPEIKLWTCSVRKLKDCFDDLKDLDEIKINDFVLDLIKKETNKLATTFVRRKINNSLFKYQPIKGKSPNENFQYDDVWRGICQNRLYLAHSMGLGKTFIIVNIINQLWNISEIDKVIVLCQQEGVYNFKRELLKFSDFFKEEDIFIMDRFNRQPFESNPKVIILTYRSFVLLSDDYYKLNNPKGTSKKYRTSQIPFDKWGNKRCIVLDEAQNIMTKSSKTSHLILLHKDFFEYRYCMSGTPDPNGVKGYWPQIHFLDEIIINDNYEEWKESIAFIGTKYSKYAINKYKEKRVEKFIDTIRPLVVRRLSKDHLDLPDLYIKKIYLDLSKKQKRLYQLMCIYGINKVIKEKKEYEEKYNKKFHETDFMIRTFPFITQSLHNPCLLKGKIDYNISPELYELIEGWEFDEHSKLDILDELTQRYVKDEKRKIIIWSGHPLTIEQLAERYNEYNPFKIHGQIGFNNKGLRDEIIEEFKSSKKRNLLVGSYLVMSTTINLIEVTRSIYFDRSYDFKYWSQSIKRNHRIGQKETVITNPLLFDHTLESGRQDKVLEQRQEMNDNLFNREALTLDEWKRIFDGEDDKFLQEL